MSGILLQEQALLFHNMFNPLLPDLSTLKNDEVDNKITELMQKYFLASKFGQSGLMQQISVILEVYRNEQSRRQQEANKKLMQNRNQDLDEFIKIDR
jgi:hypothetical protein